MSRRDWDAAITDLDPCGQGTPAYASFRLSLRWGA